MRVSRILTTIIAFVVLPGLSSCSRDLEFDKRKWLEKEDIFYKYRKQMLNDLLKNRLNSRMTGREVELLLGRSDFSGSTEDENFTFEIYVDYGWDIDPIEFQNLVITIASDSTIEKVYLDTWKRAVKERVVYDLK